MTWLSWIAGHRRKVILLGLLLLGVVAVAWHFRRNLDWEAIVAVGKSTPAILFIAAFLILPVFGFPISLLLVLAGVRFGTWRGMGLATTGVFFHHLVVHRLAHGWMRDRLGQRLSRAGLAIPQVAPRHRIWFTSLFAAIQGPPYAFKLYLLALTDIPFRIYLLAGAPVYSLFCLVPISAGSAATAITPNRIYLTLALVLSFIALGRYLKKRFGHNLAREAEAEPVHQDHMTVRHPGFANVELDRDSSKANTASDEDV